MTTPITAYRFNVFHFPNVSPDKPTWVWVKIGSNLSTKNLTKPVVRCV